MKYSDLQKFSTSLYNDVSFEEFESLCKIQNYTSDYIKKLWNRWTENPFRFVCSHLIGEQIFELIQNKNRLKSLVEIS